MSQFKTSQNPTQVAPEGRTRPAVRWILGVTGAALFAWACLRLELRSHVENALAQLESLGPLAPVLFSLLYIVGTVFLMPGSILTLGAGALFGVVQGSILVSLASTIGATLSFLIGRYVARNWVMRRIAGNPNFTSIDHSIAKEGWKIVILVRLSPGLPFAAMNYAFGLTGVSLRDYVLATWAGTLPGTVLYVYGGVLLRSGTLDAGRTPLQKALYGVGLLATLGAMIVISRIARNALTRRTADEPAQGFQGGPES